MLATVKHFHPGFILQAKGAGTGLDELAPALAPGFVGAFVDLPWAALEPSRGAYDFSLLRRYLDWAAGNDRQLFGMVQDRDFSRGASTSRIVPRWIDSTPFNKKRADSGCIARIWTEPVNSARIALITAMAREFADHPHLEAISLQETAPGGITSASDPDYDHATYCDEICRLIRAVAPALGRIQLWQSMNWLGPADGPYLDRIAGAMAVTGAGGLTLPDAVPWDPTKPMYGVMRAWAPRLPIAFGNDTSQLGKPGGGHYAAFPELITMLVDFALAHGAHYIKLKTTFYSQAASGAALSRDYAAAVRAMVAGRSLVADVPAILRPAPEPEAPAVDRAAMLAMLAELDSWLARARLALGA